MITTEWISQFDTTRPSSSILIGDSMTITQTGARLVRVQPDYLPTGSEWPYPVGVENCLTTKTISPSIRQRWGFVEPIGDFPEGTRIVLRPFDSFGTRFFWNGAAWIPITIASGLYNDLASINANLPFLNIDTIGWDVCLETTDKDRTPTLSAIKIQYTARLVDPFEAWIYEGVVRSMADAIRPLTDYVVPGNGTASIDLSANPLDADWNIVDVVEAYNLTADPNRQNDILAGYADPIISLTSAPAASDDVWLVCRYAPQVAITTDSDYTEDAKAPAILITSINFPDRLNRALGTTGPSIINRTTTPPTGTATPVPTPLLNIDFTLATVAPTALDLVKLNGALSNWLLSHPLLRSSHYDETVRLEPGLLTSWSTDTSSVGDPRMSAGSFRLLNVPWYTTTQTSNFDGSATALMGTTSSGVYGVSTTVIKSEVLGGTGKSETSTDPC